MDEATQQLLDLAPPPEVLAKSTLMLIDGEIEDRKWDQSQWGEVLDCGTTCCVAGHLALEIGLHPTTDGDRLVLDHLAPEPGMSYNSGTISPWHLGRVLGLDLDQGEWLFDGDRDEAEVRAALTHVANGQPSLVPSDD